jgi:hypothetical protein
MNVRQAASQWMKDHYPNQQLKQDYKGSSQGLLRTSKYISELEEWFITGRTDYFDKGREGVLLFLLQQENDLEQFHYLRIPFSFFRENQRKFEVRPDGKQFDLHISALKGSWLEVKRSNGISFRSFEQI